MPDLIELRVVKGGFQPASETARQKLRERGYHTDDVVYAEIRKPRNPKFHRLAHALGQLLAENIEDFHGMDAHKVLKRLQLEGNIECDEIAYRIPDYGMIVQKIPRSLSFASLDEDDFRGVMRSICRHISERYWPDLSPEQIEQMSELMVSE